MKLSLSLKICVNALILSLKLKPQPQNSCQVYEYYGKTMYIIENRAIQGPCDLLNPLLLLKIYFICSNTYTLQY